METEKEMLETVLETLVEMTRQLDILSKKTSAAATSITTLNRRLGPVWKRIEDNDAD